MIVEDAVAATRPMARFALAAEFGGRNGMSDDANPIVLFPLASGDKGSRVSLAFDASSFQALSDAISARSASFSYFAAEARARASSNSALCIADGGAVALDDMAFAFARPSSQCA